MFDFDAIGDAARRARERAERERRAALLERERERQERERGAAAWERIRDAWDDTRDYLRERVVDVLEPVYEYVSYVVGDWFWVLETIEIVYPVHFYRFVVHGDERTCPECAAWHGTTWEEGNDLVAVPIHVNCRCQVMHAWTEWRTRYVQDWRLRWRTWTEWEWRLTGWD